MEVAWGECGVDVGEGCAVGEVLEGDLFFLEGGGDGDAGGVEGLSKGGFLVVGDVLDGGSGESEGALFSKDGDAGFIESARVGGGGDEFEGLGMDGGDLLVHGRGVG